MVMDVSKHKLSVSKSSDERTSICQFPVLAKHPWKTDNVTKQMIAAVQER